MRPGESSSGRRTAKRWRRRAKTSSILQYAKIAIANPDHAPYGTAAKQALMNAGVWNAISSRVVYGENVQQTLQFAQSGNAEISIVALSLAIVSEGQYLPIDAALHD